MKPARLLAVIALGAWLVGCQSSPQERTYVTTLGSDTLTVESFLRTDTLITGVIVERTPFTYRIDYKAEVGEDGRLLRVDGSLMSPSPSGDGPGGNKVTVRMLDGQAEVVRVGGANAGREVFDAPATAIPTLGRVNTSAFIMEQIDRQLQAGDPIELIGPSSSAPRPASVRVISPDSIAMDFFGNPKYAWYTRSGTHQLLGVSGASTTLKAETRPADPIDMDALAILWATMDAAGAGIGRPSPPATATASFMDAEFEVSYSQPAKRGREIWGGLVPHGEVWRTGANAATVLTTSRDLMMGDTAVPAGSYSLWTLFTDDAATLILNSETGQWGTDYKESLDFARIPMVETPIEETERFTIRVDEMEDGGALSLAWDRTQFTVEFQPN